MGVTDPGSFQTFTGSTSAMVIDPNNPGSIILGSVNGGIWTTSNGGATDGTVVWTPRTETMLSLSVAALAMDPSNSANLIAGIGPISNAAGAAGPTYGVQLSNNGGQTWTMRSVDGAAGLGITATARYGTTLLAGSSNLQDGYSPGGLFRSLAGGVFTAVTLPSSDANAPVTGIIRSTLTASDVIIAAGGGGTNQAPTIYRGAIDGNAWTVLDTPGSDFATYLSTKSAYVSGDATQRYDKVVRLASGPEGTIAAAVAQLTLSGTETKSSLSAVFLSNDNGATWTRISVTGAPVNSGGQALTNLSIAVDPLDKKTVYVAGDSSATAHPTLGYYLPIYKLTLNADNTTTVTDISILNNTTVHADARGIAFDSNNRLIVLNDGGIYTLVNGTWRGLNGNLQLGEYYQVGYDSRNKRVGAAAQDNGVQLQNAANSPAHSLLSGGDGINISFADRNGPNTIVYSSLQNLSLSRGTIDSTTGVYGNVVQLQLYDGATLINPDGGEDRPGSAPFSSKFVLNKFNQNNFIVGTTSVYSGVDNPNNLGTAGAVSINVTQVGTGGLRADSNPAEISAIAYGVTGNTSAILAGSDAGRVFLAPDGTSTSWSEKVDYRNQGGLAPQSVVFDARTIQRFYVADGTNVWGTTDTGTAFTNLNASLPTSFVNPRALEFISLNGVNALVVGGLNSATGLGNQIAVASSKTDGTLYNWDRLGSGLPNAAIYSLYYSTPADVLVAGTMGRGAWTLYDVTTYFSQATTLAFGKADNNSAPIASQLTQGTDENGVTFTRGVNKSGLGTMTIGSGITAGYQGQTVIDGGTMLVNGSIASSSDVAINDGGTLGGSGTVPLTAVNAGGSLAPTGNLTVNGTLTFGAGSNYVVNVAGTSADKTTVNATAALTGGTVVTNVLGAPLSNSYTILTSAGLNGTTFAGARNGNQTAFLPTLNYSTTDVSLHLTAALATSGSGNQNNQAVANALDNYFNNGGTMPAGFVTLYGLSGAALDNAEQQLSGQPGASAAQTGFAANAQFVNAIFDGAFDESNGSGAIGFADAGDGAASAYASGRKPSRQAQEAYAAVTPRDRFAPRAAQAWNVWASAYGGNSRVSGDSAAGTATTTSRIFGAAAGATYRATPDTQLGFALGGAGSNFGLGGGLGGGRADIFNAAVFARHNFGAAYLAGLFGYAWQDTTTERNVTIAGTDRLTANFKAQALSARIEGGWRYVTPAFGSRLGVTPFAALQTATFHLPSYGETAASGSSLFALNYAAQNVTATRGELGARFDKAMMVPGGVLTWKAKTAWAHDWNTGRSATATFQALPGVTFVTNGATPAANAALLSLGADMEWHNGWTLAASFDGEFSRTTAGYSGKGSLKYKW